MVIASAPMRISYLGGGSDIPYFIDAIGSGFVISAAINKRTTIVLQESFYDKWILSYSKKETIDDIEEADNGLISCAVRHFGIETPLEISSVSSIPYGVGLGGSGAYATALVAALYKHVYNRVPDTETLFRIVNKIEIDGLGQKIGYQDQLRSIHGGIGTIRFLQYHMPYNIIKINDSFSDVVKAHTMLFYFSLRSTSSGTVLGNIQKEKNIEHIKQIKQYAIDGEAAFLNRDICGFSKLINDSWLLKRELDEGKEYEKIDRVHEIAISSGALGGKLCGAGRGGVMLLMVPPYKQENMKKIMESCGGKYIPFEFDFTGAKVHE